MCETASQSSPVASGELQKLAEKPEGVFDKLKSPKGFGLIHT